MDDAVAKGERIRFRETVNPDVPSTLEAAALCKMADRKQITGGVVDGPLALDNAISLEAVAALVASARRENVAKAVV